MNRDNTNKFAREAISSPAVPTEQTQAISTATVGMERIRAAISSVTVAPEQARTAILSATVAPEQARAAISGAKLLRCSKHLRFQAHQHRGSQQNI